MWADPAVVLTAAIAVVAHQPVSILGPAATPKISSYAGPSTMRTMFSAASVLMIDCEESWVSFAATDAFPAVGFDHQSAGLNVSCPVALKNRFSIGVIVGRRGRSGFLSALLRHARPVFACPRCKKFKISFTFLLPARVLDLFSPKVNVVKPSPFALNLFWR